MFSASRAALAAIVLAAPIVVVHAQLREQDHAAHHPELQGAQPGTPPASQPGMPMPGMKPPGQNGGISMMGGNMQPMMRMMQMMHEQMAEQMEGRMGGMIPLEHVKGHIAFLKAELGITDAQEPQWNAFADALQAQALKLQALHEQMMKGGVPSTWQERLAHEEQMLSARLETVKAIEAPALALYSVLSPEQQKKADELVGTPTGMM